MKPIELAGLTFYGTSLDFLESDEFQFVITVNAEFIVKAQSNSRLHQLINKYTSTLDGTIPFWLASLKNPGRTITKISGSDLIYDVCALAHATNRKVFLLGGHPESNALAIKNLSSKYPGLIVDGYSSPPATYPFPETLENEISERLHKFRPDYLFVGYGVIKQEFWIDDRQSFLKDLGTRLAVGCGGTYDFVSGRIVRAPKIVQKIGLEGIWRLVMEPKLFRVKRVLVSFGIFYYALRSKRHRP